MPVGIDIQFEISKKIIIIMNIIAITTWPQYRK